MTNFKSSIYHNLINIPGLRTNRKILVIESDDWGSIRMPSKNVYFQLLKAGVRVDKCPYCKNDSLETMDDLSFLFDALISIKDKNGNSAIITANTLVANPDFNRIRESAYNVYTYKKITETYKEIKGCERNLELWKQGKDSGCFEVQSHGREHLNINRWMHYLKSGFSETLLAFNLGVYGISTTITTEKRKSFLAAFEFESEKEEQIVNGIAEDGLIIFKEIFGYNSKSFIAPNYAWGKSLEYILKNNGVEYIQGGQIHSYCNVDGKNMSKRLRYTGNKNQIGQFDLARNAFFEPVESPDKDWVNICLSQINRAFRWGHPAIICSHRANFVSSLNRKNRDQNLKMLMKLLLTIKKNWPNVEFMSSAQLGDFIKNR